MMVSVLIVAMFAMVKMIVMMVVTKIIVTQQVGFFAASCVRKQNLSHIFSLNNDTVLLYNKFTAIFC